MKTPFEDDMQALLASFSCSDRDEVEFRAYSIHSRAKHLHRTVVSNAAANVVAAYRFDSGPHAERVAVNWLAATTGHGAPE